jgi:hypothetical protein
VICTKVLYIQSFLFNNAIYDITDRNNNQAQLIVNYKDNSYVIKKDNEVTEEAMEELKEIAKDLLQRKHGVNIAECN